MENDPGHYSAMVFNVTLYNEAYCVLEVGSLIYADRKNQRIIGGE